MRWYQLDLAAGDDFAAGRRLIGAVTPQVIAASRAIGEPLLMDSDTETAGAAPAMTTEQFHELVPLAGTLGIKPCARTATWSSCGFRTTSASAPRAA